MRTAAVRLSAATLLSCRQETDKTTATIQLFVIYGKTQGAKDMSSDTVLGLGIIGGFLLVCIAEGVAIIVLTYKLGIYKGRLARYELPEKQSPATVPQQ